MKYFIPTVLIAAGILAGCQKEICQEIVNTGIPSEFKGEIEEFAETRTYLDENNNIRWYAKDQVIIFAGTTGGGKYEITEDSIGETSANYDYIGTAGGGFGSGNDITSNVAFYPFQSGIKCANADNQTPTQSFTLTRISLPADQTYQAGSFGQGTFPMVAVTSSKEDMLLKFKNVCGGIKLLLKGDVKVRYITVKGNNDEPLAGTASVTAYVNSSAPMVTMGEGAATEVTLDCGREGVQLNTAEAVPFIIALPPTDFKGGFSVSITDTRGYKMDIRTSKQNIVTRSNLVRMPEISYKANGTAPITDAENIAIGETANSYIVGKGGSYSIPAVKGNSSESIGEAVSAEVLWESFGTDTAPAKGDLIIAAEYSEGKILFRVNDEFKEGNAVIAAKDASGTILWSWHIWLVEDEIQEHVYANNAGTMMDRNLGAVSATRGDIGALGLLYQWGRKDPFLNASSLTGTVSAKSTIEWPTGLYTSDATIGTIEYTIQNPTVFIGGRGNNSGENETYQDWYYDFDDEISQTRWADEKTIYDPCPAGWQVSSPDIWEESGIAERYSQDMTYHTPDEVNIGFSISHNGYDIWFPTRGARSMDYGVAGSCALEGQWRAQGTYWTDRYYNSSPQAYIILFYGEGKIGLLSYYPSKGYQVRCQKTGTGE